MKRSAFYRTYYKITNRAFSDRVIQTAEDRESAWRKRQHLTSKTERKLLIVLQYLTLLCCWIPQLLVQNGWILMVAGIALFLLFTLTTDFSMIKIEILYHLYRRNNPYCALLYKAFLGELDPFWDLLKKKTKKYVTGYVRKNRRKLCAKYIAVSRDRNSKATLTVRHNCVVVKVNGIIRKINNPALSTADLADEIAAVISSAKKAP